MNYQKELLLLEIRDLVASKELVIATANQNLAQYGEWQCDWSKVSGEITAEIVALIKKFNELPISVSQPQQEV